MRFLLIKIGILLGTYCLNAQEKNLIKIDREAFPVNMDIIVKKIKYPSKLKKQKIEGKVIAKVLVNNEGKVQQHEILQSPHLKLSKSVINKLNRLKFIPAEADGKKVACWVVIPFVFVHNLSK